MSIIKSHKQNLDSPIRTKIKKMKLEAEVGIISNSSTEKNTLRKSVNDEQVNDLLELHKQTIINNAPAGIIPGYSAQTRNDRNDYIVGLYNSGIQSRSILKALPDVCNARGWQPLTTEKALMHVIAKHHQSKKPIPADQAEVEEGLKAAAFGVQEGLIEKFALYIKELEAIKKDPNSKYVVKPFEYMTAIEKMAALQQQLIENRNWNDSRKNNNIIIQQNSQVNIFKDNESALKNDPEVQSIIDLIDLCEQTPNIE